MLFRNTNPKKIGDYANSYIKRQLIYYTIGVKVQKSEIKEDKLEQYVTGFKEVKPIYKTSQTDTIVQKYKLGDQIIQIGMNSIEIRIRKIANKNLEREKQTLVNIVEELKGHHREYHEIKD